MIHEFHHGPVRSVFAAVLLLLAAGLGAPAGAENLQNIPVTIRDHQFFPSELHVPAGTPVILTITNEDSTKEEFDSVQLKVEKVIAGGAYGTIRLRPLGPGRYRFIGEFHWDTAQGVVIADPSGVEIPQERNFDTTHSR